MNTNVRSALAASSADQLEDLGLHRHVERRGRLVEHDDGGVHRQGAGDGDALGLAAGQLVGPAAEDRRRRGRRGRRAWARRRSCSAAGSPMADIGSRIAWPAVRRGLSEPTGSWNTICAVAWKRRRSPPARLGDVDAADLDASRRWGHQAHQHPGQRGLARPALADDAERLAAGDREVDAVQHVVGLGAEAAAELDVQVARRAPRAPSSPGGAGRPALAPVDTARADSASGWKQATARPSPAAVSSGRSERHVVVGAAAAGRERARRGHGGEQRHRPAGGHDRSAVELGHGVEQRPRVGVGGARQHLAGRAVLDHRPGVEHHQPVAELGDRGDVVGHQQHAAVLLVGDGAEQLEDVARQRHVESGRRLVGEQQAGPAGQGGGDHHPLAHPARQLVGVGAVALLGVAQPDVAQQRAAPRRGPRRRRARGGRRGGRRAGGRWCGSERAPAAGSGSTAPRPPPRCSISSRPDSPSTSRPTSAHRPRHPGAPRQGGDDRAGDHRLAAAALADEPDHLAVPDATGRRRSAPARCAGGSGSAPTGR